MGVFTALSMVVVVVVMVGSGQGLPAAHNPSSHWQHWKQLQQQHMQQQKERQQQQEQLWAQMGQMDPAVERQRVGVLWEAQDRQRQRQLQLEQEKDMLEEMEKIIEDNQLEDLVHQLGVDAVGRILRPLRQQPAIIPMDDCVTRTTPVMFTQLGVGGNFVYTVCGSGNGAALHLHFQSRYPIVHTTPSFETTTRQEDTPVPTPVNDQPPCPIHPDTTTPSEAEVVTPEAEETTTVAADENTTTPAI